MPPIETQIDTPPRTGPIVEEAHGYNEYMTDPSSPQPVAHAATPNAADTQQAVAAANAPAPRLGAGFWIGLLVFSCSSPASSSTASTPAPPPTGPSSSKTNRSPSPRSKSSIPPARASTARSACPATPRPTSTRPSTPAPTAISPSGSSISAPTSKRAS